MTCKRKEIFLFWLLCNTIFWEMNFENWKSDKIDNRLDQFSDMLLQPRIKLQYACIGLLWTNTKMEIWICCYQSSTSSTWWPVTLVACSLLPAMNMNQLLMLNLNTNNFICSLSYITVVFCCQWFFGQCIYAHADIRDLSHSVVLYSFKFYESMICIAMCTVQWWSSIWMWGTWRWWLWSR